MCVTNRWTQPLIEMRGRIQKEEELKTVNKVTDLEQSNRLILNHAICVITMTGDASSCSYSWDADGAEDSTFNKAGGKERGNGVLNKFRIDTTLIDQCAGTQPHTCAKRYTHSCTHKKIHS